MGRHAAARARPGRRAPANGARVTLALSTHRPETLTAADALMASHDVICLEEPPTPGFADMLSGALDIEAYLPETGTEYPAFTRSASRLLRDQHRQGKTILQIEPYLEALLTLQLRLADGESPARAAAAAPFDAVYAAEKSATGALIDFYQTAGGGDLDATVGAVLAFAAADARRFRLRDHLRATALTGVLDGPGRVYIEAGVMHLSLIRRLIAAGRPGRSLSVVHLQADHARRLCGRPLVMAPGDRLTFRKIFGRRHDSGIERLLAAQSLIYNRIIETDEQESPAGGHPHLSDEHLCITMVESLDMAACRALYPHVHRLPAKTARAMVAAFIDRHMTPAHPRHF
jgi:hypothetical protein